MPKEEIDVWVPETRLGYFQLFYFGVLVAAICIGRNTGLSAIWSGIAIGH